MPLSLAGPAIIAADELYRQTGVLATLQPETLDGIKQLCSLEFTGNPVAMRDDVCSATYTKVLQMLLNDSTVDVVIALHLPSTMAGGRETAVAVLNVLKAVSEITRKKQM